MIKKEVRGRGRFGQFKQTKNPLTEPIRGINKIGQFQISFAMIFSILIIVAIIGVAFYVIQFFLGINDCGQTGTFYDKFQDEVDKAWKSPSYGGDFTLNVANGIEYVCFGLIDSMAGNFKSEELQSEIDLSQYASDTANVFLYPGGNACDGGLANNKIDHLDTEGFSCVKVNNGKVSVRLDKGVRDSLVNLILE